nr:beta-mannosidase [Pseudopedobacter sp.]
MKLKIMILKFRTIFFLAIFLTEFSAFAQQEFVKVENGHFMLKNKEYKYVGANYWYGGLLALKGNEGKQRLKKELNFLKRKGVTNLRVMLGAEGTSTYKFRISNKDVLQPQKGEFRDSILFGLDYLLNEMQKRNMKAVLHFTNTWEWSGGLSEYLKWNNYPDSPNPKDEGYNWDTYRQYITQFYNCEPCKKDVDRYINYILHKSNSINGLMYKNDPTIMAWEIINEPRPMRSENNEAFALWMKKTASLIKSLDSNHLLTTGSEGAIATDNNMDLYKQLHADSNIDYLTIHLWPKNWGWFKDTAINASFSNIISNTKIYIKKHELVATELNKPLVIEEFGLPRDLHSFDIHSTTYERDKFYKAVFNIVDNSSVIDGTNFWSLGGLARPIPGQTFWKDGDDYMGDPGGEEQGLNSIFIKDKSTWKIIKHYAKEN